MKYFALLFLLFSAHFSFAQPYIIKGSVSDTLNSAMLHKASVVIIRTTDSVIESFTHTSADGKFEMKVAKPGKYRLRISFPSFADYTDVLTIKKTTTDLGIVPMISKEHLLKEFVLTQHVAAIKIKGDTTEYMADSFKVKEGATVEDLLKKLPGIQVDKNGQITAQGETVQKILVDGEEFFSDDPKVVTKGLQANAVERVQVFNKKSEQAEFTGIDDGQKTKTINLELKEDMKKGYFGKIDAGGGTDGYFQNQGMINAFKAKRQFSAFAIMSNTDKVGLGWQDNNKFGGGGNTMITDDGSMITYYGGSNDDFGAGNYSYNGQGLPHTWTGGAHYADKWKEEKNHITANYRYAMQNVDMVGSTTTTTVLPDTNGNNGNNGNVSKADKTQFSKGERHGFDFMYEWKIDSSTTLKLTTDAGYKQSDLLTHYNTTTTDQESTRELNSNDRTIKSFATSNYVNADLLLKKKFNKKGRTLSVDVKENYKESKSNGTLNSSSEAFVGTQIIKTNTNQEKVTNSNTLAFAAKATYTEPVSKVAFVEVNYGVTVNNSIGENFSYNYDSTTQRFSTTADGLFSSDYKFNILTNRGGANMKFVYKHYNFSFGSDVSNTSYLQADLIKNTTRKYSYINYFPTANLTYNISKQTSIKLYYYGNTQQPTLTQIQPLVQNTDPLNQTEGNTNLKQEFRNTISLNFNDYKVLKSRYIYGNLSFSTVSDAISTRQISINGFNRTKYINVDGNYSGYAYFGGGFNLKKIDLMIGIHGNSSLNHVNNIVINDTIKVSPTTTIPNNKTDYNTYNIGPYFRYNKDKVCEISLNPGITYNYNKSSISTFSTSYFTYNIDLDGTVQLPWKCEIGTSVDFMFREKTPSFPNNNNVIKWNAFVSKKFLKGSQLELKLSVLDILNQNIGFTRTAQAGSVVENNYNTIRRYGMMQLIWNFTHTPAGVKPEVSGPMIIMN